MSREIMRKYIDILNEAMGKETQEEARYMDMSTSRDKCGNCSHFEPPHTCKIVDGYIDAGGWCKHYTPNTIGEKWGEETKVSPSERGKYKGKTIEELRKSYNALKASGPHHKGSHEYGRMRELAFAIRAKTGWGGVD